MPGMIGDPDAAFLNGHAPIAPHRFSGGWGPESKPHVRIPEGEQQHRDTAAELAPLMHDERRWYAQGESVVAQSREVFALEPVSIDRSVTEFEGAAKFYTVKIGKDGISRKVLTKLTATTARVLLRSVVMIAALPRVRALSRCPVLLVRAGTLVPIVGFDRESGILVHRDARTPEECEWAEGSERLASLIGDFRFTTEGDRARAVAAMLTPALMRSGLLGEGRCPLIVLEADDSQAGKGYFVRVFAAVYADTPRTITQREGGVGSVSESLASALQEGNAFIGLDNWRGPINVPSFEAMLTERRVECRVPHKGSTTVDPSLTTFSLTSNGAELTIDLANRSNIVRILKQPTEFRFRDWPEGGLLEHVGANQPAYLGAVWAIVREWHRRGCPCAPDDGAHDFRRWARAVRFIVRDMLGLADPLGDYRAIQRSKATPALTWLRSVGLAVKRARKDGLELRAHDLWGVCVENGLEVPGLSASDAMREDDASRTRALQGIGRRLAAAFGSRSVLDVDGTPVHRFERPGDNGRPERSYVFGDVAGGPPPDPPPDRALWV